MEIEKSPEEKTQETGDRIGYVKKLGFGIMILVLTSITVIGTGLFAYFISPRCKDNVSLASDIQTALGQFDDTSPICPPGWLGFKKRSCYLIGYVSITYVEAKAFCEKEGASMIHVDSAEENEMIANYFNTFQDYSYWVGIADGHWSDDGSSVELTNWGPGEPNNPRGSCVVFSYNHKYKWDDVFCTDVWAPICEKNMHVERKVQW